MKKLFLMALILTLFTACDSNKEEDALLRNTTGNVVESGRQQVDGIKSQAKTTSEELKQGVTELKDTASEVREAEEAIGNIFKDDAEEQ